MQHGNCTNTGVSGADQSHLRKCSPMQHRTLRTLMLLVQTTRVAATRCNMEMDSQLLSRGCLVRGMRDRTPAQASAVVPSQLDSMQKRTHIKKSRSSGEKCLVSNSSSLPVRGEQAHQKKKQGTSSK